MARQKSRWSAPVRQKPDRMRTQRGPTTALQQEKLDSLWLHLDMLVRHKSAVLSARDEHAFRAAQRDFDRLYQAIAADLRSVGLPPPRQMTELWEITRRRIGGEAELEAALDKFFDRL
jgi:hypothetical protein